MMAGRSMDGLLLLARRPRLATPSRHAESFGASHGSAHPTRNRRDWFSRARSAPASSARNRSTASTSSEGIARGAGPIGLVAHDHTDAVAGKHPEGILVGGVVAAIERVSTSSPARIERVEQGEDGAALVPVGAGLDVEDLLAAGSPQLAVLLHHLMHDPRNLRLVARREPAGNARRGRISCARPARPRSPTAPPRVLSSPHRGRAGRPCPSPRYGASHRGRPCRNRGCRRNRDDRAARNGARRRDRGPRRSPRRRPARAGRSRRACRRSKTASSGLSTMGESVPS